jgi:glycosyltransferase involved in cell wall biosynthesis
MNEKQVLVSDMQPAVVVDPTVSVVIPVRNGGAKLRICLQSLSDCQSPPGEVIVVADGDTGKDRRVAEEFRAKVLTIPKPKGPSAARNLGARSAHGDILCFVDADVSLPRNALSQVSAAFKHDTELTAVFGSYNDSPFEKNFLSQYKNLLHHYVHQTANEKGSTFWTGTGAIRREVFVEMGGFNEEFICIEDIELGYRLWSAGYKIRLLKDLQVQHLKRWSFISLLKTDFFCRALPWTDLILNEDRFPDDLNVKLSGRISVVFTYLLPLMLFAALWFYWLFFPAVLLVSALIALNWDIYYFFYKKRGLVFTIKSVFWHWFYFFYSGLAFAIGLAKHSIKRTGPKKNRKHKLEIQNEFPSDNDLKQRKRKFSFVNPNSMDYQYHDEKLRKAE